MLGIYYFDVEIESSSEDMAETNQEQETMDT